MRTLIDLLRDWMPEQRWFRGSGASELRHLGSYVLEHIGDDEDVYRIIVALIVDEQTLPESGSVPAATIYQVPLVLREADSDASARGNLVFVQEFLPGVEDAWRAALRAGASGDDFLTPARTLGQATAEVHAVLRKVMPTVPTTPERVEAALAAMRTRLDATIAEVPALAEFRERALACFAAARDAEWPISQRIHGDYHLGQVLAVPGRNWVLLDFEGEPLSPLEVRNAPDCAVRDVAGMLRSFDYVSGSLTMTAGSEQAHDWAIAARKAFIEGYGEGLVEQGIEGKELRALLDERVCAAYEIDKALYEARYEALHRPDWLGIPMGAIERLLGERESAASNR